jgi:hypothetical protein
VKDFQATGEAFSPQKRTCTQHFKTWNLFPFFHIIGSFFALMDPEPTKITADPDPQHCKKEWESERWRGRILYTTAKMEGLFIYSFYDARPPEETHSLNLFMPHVQEQGSWTIACKFLGLGSWRDCQTVADSVSISRVSISLVVPFAR